MALTRLEADRDRTILYYPKPAKVPLVVHALRVVVGITLLLVLTSLVVQGWTIGVVARLTGVELPPGIFSSSE